MSRTEQIYGVLTDDDDGRLCQDIDASACEETPRSFVLLLTSLFLTKLGDAIASPKTTLAWLTTSLGAPGWVLGYLVPIRESGAMVPQLFLGGVVRRLPIRKWVWVVGSVAQGLCIAGLALVAFTLEGTAAGWAMLGLVAAFSLARSLSSIASKDVIGKTIPKPRRGQLSGWAASAAGAVTIAVGLVIGVVSGASIDAVLLGWLLVGAAFLWWLAAGVFSRIDEQAGATDGGRSLLGSLGSLRLLVDDRAFRRFVIARALLMCSALSAPFYVALAQGSAQAGIATLGGFVVASGLASLVSGPIWGRFADRSSRAVMAAAAVVTAGIGLATFAVDGWLPDLAASAWFLPLAYLVLSVAHQGVRVGRKTYVVNLGEGNQRTDYVAISNTVIGVLLLVVGSVGALTPWLGNGGVIALLSLMGLAGAVMSWRLPDV